MPQELDSCFYQLDYGFVICCFAYRIHQWRWELTYCIPWLPQPPPVPLCSWQQTYVLRGWNWRHLILMTGKSVCLPPPCAFIQTKYSAGLLQIPIVDLQCGRKPHLMPLISSTFMCSVCTQFRIISQILLYWVSADNQHNICWNLNNFIIQWIVFIPKL